MVIVAIDMDVVVANVMDVVVGEELLMWWLLQAVPDELLVW